MTGNVGNGRHSAMLRTLPSGYLTDGYVVFPSAMPKFIYGKLYISLNRHMEGCINGYIIYKT